MVWIKGSGAGRTRGNSELLAYAEAWAGVKSVQVWHHNTILCFSASPSPMIVFDLTLHITPFRGSTTPLGETPSCQNSNAFCSMEEFCVKILLLLNKTGDSQMFSQDRMLHMCYSCHWVSAREVLWHLQCINPHILKTISLDLIRHLGVVFISTILYMSDVSNIT